MAYKTLYRVFRPTGFAEVYGQHHITDILKKQVEDGKASHAYLFCGPRGTGKTSTAKIFANALNCLNPKDGEPCGECEVCRSFRNDSFVDIVEIDAASNNGVDNVRDIREKVSLLPAQGKYKVYIIDEVHMLSTGAFNALLKTLEEPPPHAVFILATTENRKVPATILSRCQKYDFKRITDADIVARMEYIARQEGIEYEKDALKLIAQQAEGAMRDALSIMDQCIAGGRPLTLQTVTEAVGIADSAAIHSLTDAVMGEDAAAAVGVTSRMLADGVSAANIMRDLISALSIELANNAKDSYKCSGILRSIEALIAAQANLRYSSVPNAVLTAAVVRATVNTVDVDTQDMELRLKKLEQRVEKVIQRMGRGAPATQQLPGQKPEQQPEAQPKPVMPEEKQPETRFQPPMAERQPEVPQPAKQPEALAQPQGAGGQDASGKLGALKDAALNRNMVLFPAFNAAQRAERLGGKLVLYVPEEDIPVAEMLTSDLYGVDVNAVLREVFGQEMKIEVAKLAGGQQEPQADDDMQQELVELFGEENVDIIE